MSDIEEYDVVVIGGGPGGLKAALEAAERGRSVLLIESEPKVGGSCVERGTIPSKALRETAISLEGFKRRTGSVFEVSAREDLKVASLMIRLEQVVRGHGRFLSNVLGEACIVHRHGRGRFVDAHTVEVLRVDGGRDLVRGEFFVIATGSRPRIPDSIPVDHAHILTSESIQCLTYLPRSLAVLGGGVIACEYASTFSSLGVEVTLVDRKPRPLGFVDPELSACFLSNFTRAGHRWLGAAAVRRVRWDGASQTVVELEDGREARAEKCLVALGRIANTRRLQLDEAGVTLRENDTVAVDEVGRTVQPHIYAVGDVVGHPGLAAAAIEQGRRAIRHALGLPLGCPPRHTPFAVYTIPEISCVGLDEETARRELGGDILVGRARLDELARGQIAALRESLLKLITDRCGRILGVQIFGEGAAELITVGQMALRGEMSIDDLLETVFNFPTLAEAYRVAALEVSRQRDADCAIPQLLPEPQEVQS